MAKLHFEKLVSLAQQERMPSVDVADDVMATLSSLERIARNDYRAYTWMGAASAAIAACIVITAAFFMQSNTDSVSEIMTYVSWVAQ